MNFPRPSQINLSLKKFSTLQKTILVLAIFALVTVLALFTSIFKPKIAPARDCSQVTKADNAVVIKMENGQFDPKTLNVKVCDTLLFLNLDTESKWPRVGSAAVDQIYPGFDAGHELAKYDYFEFQVTRPGSYSFYDHLHKKVNGNVKIQDQ